MYAASVGVILCLRVIWKSANSFEKVGLTGITCRYQTCFIVKNQLIHDFGMNMDVFTFEQHAYCDKENSMPTVGFMPLQNQDVIISCNSKLTQYISLYSWTIRNEYVYL